MKVTLAEYTEDNASVARFFREAKVVAQINDPNIIDIYDADLFRDSGQMYILMPFIEGESLESLCRRSGPLALDREQSIAAHVASDAFVAERRTINAEENQTVDVQVTLQPATGASTPPPPGPRSGASAVLPNTPPPSYVVPLVLVSAGGAAILAQAEAESKTGAKFVPGYRQPRADDGTAVKLPDS